MRFNVSVCFTSTVPNVPDEFSRIVLEYTMVLSILLLPSEVTLT